MKWKRIGIIALLITVLSGTGLYAAGERTSFSILFNRSEIGESGLTDGGHSYLPLRELAGKLQAITFWSNGSKTLQMYKPNVNLVLINEKGGLFGSVPAGSKFSFKVLVQVDNLKTAISALKVDIANPSGKTENVGTRSIDENKEYFWYGTKEITYEFENEGAYPVRVYMKKDAGDDWSLVSELQIIAK